MGGVGWLVGGVGWVRARGGRGEWEGWGGG